MVRPLTKRQKQVLDFIEDFIRKNVYPPTLEEIKDGLGVSAVSTIHQHINVLVGKGYLNKIENSARAIEIKEASDIRKKEFVEIPLLGLIAAGTPIEAIEIPETITVPKELVSPSGKHYALRVQGVSMQEAQIFNGDIVVIREQSSIKNGEIGVAIIDGKATLKRIFREKNGFRLEPANKDYQPFFARYLEIRGKLTGVLRKPVFVKTSPDLPEFIQHESKNVLRIQNRRFLGNKYRLLGFIGDIVADKCAGYQSFCDIFAGTGVVGHYFNRPDVQIISNDILGSSFTALNCWLGTQNYDRNRIENAVSYLNSLKPRRENYFSKNFGGTYFTEENALKIGAIRGEIEVLNMSDVEKDILLTALMYATDKVANTVGHYETYRKQLDMLQSLKLLVPEITVENNRGNEIHKKDANELIREIQCDILYIDPPYNSRQYGDSYHLLENIVDWKKPEVEGIAKKMINRQHLKSRYCLKSAPEAFKDLISNADVKHILLSYNNTGEKMNSRSNARLSDQVILKTLKSRGNVEIFERDYRGFTTGKSKSGGNSERVFYCKVTK